MDTVFRAGTSDQKKINIVLVDDSAVIRGALGRILKTDPNVEIVGSVANGQDGVTKARLVQPDILILDVEMPVMDGITALPRILEASPKTKVIMCSTLTAKGADITMKALSLGAVDSIVKPSSSIETGPGSPFQRDLMALIRNLAPRSKMFQSPAPSVSSPNYHSTPATMPSSAQAPRQSTVAAPPSRPIFKSEVTIRNDPRAYKGRPSIVAIGSSTGGPQALFKVLKHCSGFNVPIVITQHMPATFTKILAEHIKMQTGITSFEGEHGMPVQNGCVYVAPGGKHMLFERIGGALKIRLDDGPQENFCKPAVDPMIRSLVDIYGDHVLGVILTGMGHDGLQGMKILVEKGGRLVAQDEATSVVWGMPGAVATNGLCSAVLPLDDIGPWIKKAVL
ncbi:MAG: chemotaxis response regulator protein-glutamate methylesterase [Alphaproteobacteria bacterium]|nr:chemotaxis response regulator protein-glutamate methylesterase [Alphaproteobacteria bacterium]